MNSPTNSFLKVYYELRPSKQIERRMLIHSFHELRNIGCNIATYQYCGMGSIFFTDYILFHKYLGIDDMVSVEYSPKAKKRVNFNKPFKFIKIKYEDIALTVSALSKNKKHLLWLDYDSFPDEDKLTTIHDAVSKLSTNSILLITFDAELLKNDENLPDPHYTFESYKQLFGIYFDSNLSIEDFTRETLPKTLIKLTSNLISFSLSGNLEKKFQPLYSFVYADGHQMLTMGGILLPKSQSTDLNKMNIDSMHFLRTSFNDDPYYINVPILTKKERAFMDSLMNKSQDVKIKEFEIEDKMIKHYQEIYRYYPNYFEALL